jgi:hypothetical protein
VSNPFEAFTSSTMELLKKDLPDVGKFQRDMAVTSTARELFLLIMKEEIPEQCDAECLRQIARWCKDAAIIFHDEISR